MAEFNDIKWLYLEFKEWVITNYIDIYKKYIWDVSERRRYIKDRQTNIASRLIFMFVETLFGAAIDSDNYFTIRTTHKWNEKSAEAMLNLIEYIHNTWNFQGVMNKAIKAAIIFWEAFIKIWYKYSKNEGEYINRVGKKMKIKELIDCPAIFFVAPYNIIYEPNEWWIQESSFVIERTMLTEEEFKKRYTFVDIKLDREIIENGEIIDDTNRDMLVREILFKWVENKSSSLLAWFFNNRPWFLKQKQLEVFELHEAGEITIFVNGKKFWPYPGISPRKKKPYASLSFTQIPWTWMNIWVWHILKDIESVYTAILNNRLDNMKIAGNKMLLHIRSVDNVLSEDDYLEFEPWKILHVSDPNALIPFSMGEVPQSPIIEADRLLDMVQQTLWVSGYWLWYQDKVERSAMAVTTLQNASLLKLKSLNDSIISAMWFILKYVAILALEYMEKDTLLKVLWEEWYEIIKDLSLDDVINNYAFDFGITSHKTIRQEQKARALQELTPLLIQLASSWVGVDLARVLDIILKWLWFTDDDILQSGWWQQMQQLLAMLQQAQQAPQAPQEQWQQI